MFQASYADIARHAAALYTQQVPIHCHFFLHFLWNKNHSPNSHQAGQQQTAVYREAGEVRTKPGGSPWHTVILSSVLTHECNLLNQSIFTVNEETLCHSEVLSQDNSFSYDGYTLPPASYLFPVRSEAVKALV